MASEGHSMTACARKFSFQIQFGHGATADRDLIDKVLKVVRKEGARVTAVSIDNEDGGPFATINAETQNPALFWRKVRAKLTAAPQVGLPKRMIIVCEGEDGWNDYLLLHHFDKTQKTDALIERRQVEEQLRH